MKELEALESEANIRRNSFELIKSGDVESLTDASTKKNTTGKPNHGEYGLVDDLGPQRDKDVPASIS